MIAYKKSLVNTGTSNDQHQELWIVWKMWIKEAKSLDGRSGSHAPQDLLCKSPKHEKLTEVWSPKWSTDTMPNLHVKRKKCLKDSKTSWASKIDAYNSLEASEIYQGYISTHQRWLSYFCEDLRVLSHRSIESEHQNHHLNYFSHTMKKEIVKLK